jgi:hypothetical protein
MRYALNLAEDGRVLSVTFKQFAPGDAVLVDDFPSNASDYRYEDCQFVYDPLPKKQEIVVQPTQEDRIAELEEALEMLLSGVTE